MIQQYFQPKIGRKMRIFNLAGETTFLYKKKKRVQRQNMEICSKSIFWVCEQNSMVTQKGATIFLLNVRT